MKKKVTKKVQQLTSKGIDPEKYILKLYITGTTPQSQRALGNIKKVCEDYLQGRYELQVIDIYQNPSLAKDEQIIAAPTLVKKLPSPLRRFIGDLSDISKILLGLDLKPQKISKKVKKIKKQND